MKRTLQPLPHGRIQGSAEGITPTTLPPRSRISQDPKQSSLQSLDSQVKTVRKKDKAPTPSPTFNSQFCCPSSELRQHTSCPLTVNLHTPSLSYIHSPLTYQALPKRNSLQSLDSQVKTVRKEDKAPRHLPASICNSAAPPLNFANTLLFLLQSTSTHRALATFIVH